MTSSVNSGGDAGSGRGAVALNRLGHRSTTGHGGGGSSSPSSPGVAGPQMAQAKPAPTIAYFPQPVRARFTPLPVTDGYVRESAADPSAFARFRIPPPDAWSNVSLCEAIPIACPLTSYAPRWDQLEDLKAGDDTLTDVWANVIDGYQRVLAARMPSDYYARNVLRYAEEPYLRPKLEGIFDEAGGHNPLIPVLELARRTTVAAAASCDLVESYLLMACLQFYACARRRWLERHTHAPLQEHRPPFLLMLFTTDFATPPEQASSSSASSASSRRRIAAASAAAVDDDADDLVRFAQKHSLYAFIRHVVTLVLADERYAAYKKVISVERFHAFWLNSVAKNHKSSFPARHFAVIGADGIIEAYNTATQACTDPRISVAQLKVSVDFKDIWKQCKFARPRPDCKSQVGRDHLERLVPTLYAHLWVGPRREILGGVTADGMRSDPVQLFDVAEQCAFFLTREARESQLVPALRSVAELHMNAALRQPGIDRLNPIARRSHHPTARRRKAAPDDDAETEPDEPENKEDEDEEVEQPAKRKQKKKQKKRTTVAAAEMQRHQKRRTIERAAAQQLISPEETWRIQSLRDAVASCFDKNQSRESVLKRLDFVRLRYCYFVRNDALYYFPRPDHMSPTMGLYARECEPWHYTTDTLSYLLERSLRRQQAPIVPTLKFISFCFHLMSNITANATEAHVREAIQSFHKRQYRYCIFVCENQQAAQVLQRVAGASAQPVPQWSDGPSGSQRPLYVVPLDPRRDTLLSQYALSCLWSLFTEDSALNKGKDVPSDQRLMPVLLMQTLSCLLVTEEDVIYETHRRLSARFCRGRATKELTVEELRSLLVQAAARMHHDLDTWAKDAEQFLSAATGKDVETAIAQWDFRAPVGAPDSFMGVIAQDPVVIHVTLHHLGISAAPSSELSSEETDEMDIDGGGGGGGGAAVAAMEDGQAAASTALVARTLEAGGATDDGANSGGAVAPVPVPVMALPDEVLEYLRHCVRANRVVAYEPDQAPLLEVLRFRQSGAANPLTLAEVAAQVIDVVIDRVCFRVQALAHARCHPRCVPLPEGLSWTDVPARPVPKIIEAIRDDFRRAARRFINKKRNRAALEAVDTAAAMELDQEQREGIQVFASVLATSNPELGSTVTKLRALARPSYSTDMKRFSESAAFLKCLRVLLGRISIQDRLTPEELQAAVDDLIADPQQPLATDKPALARRINYLFTCIVQSGPEFERAVREFARVHDTDPYVCFVNLHCGSASVFLNDTASRASAV